MASTPLIDALMATRQSKTQHGKFYEADVRLERALEKRLELSRDHNKARISNRGIQNIKKQWGPCPLGELCPEVGKTPKRAHRRGHEHMKLTNDQVNAMRAQIMEQAHRKHVTGGNLRPFRAKGRAA